MFAPENWDSLLIDKFDGNQGEQYGLLLVSYTNASSLKRSRLRLSVLLTPCRTSSQSFHFTSYS